MANVLRVGKLEFSTWTAQYYSERVAGKQSVCLQVERVIFLFAF